MTPPEPMATDAHPFDAGLFDAGHHPDTAPTHDTHGSHDAHSSSSMQLEREEADTCRICRGEGTDEEPLFYPCKCSGSIKYVHQECLMEWLSHTQKKHCELCKTSFRFTKLYHPGMPSRIPTAVFVRRAALHVLNMFLTWCRAILVGSVWLVLLPWSMRVVWRSLFWVGDGGWSRDVFSEPVDNLDASATFSRDLKRLLAESEAARNSNITELLVANSSSPNRAIIQQLQNATATESMFWTFVKRFLFGWPHPVPSLSVPASNHTVLNATTDYLGARSPSLLSDVSWFHWFNSQAANRFLIDVFEGQIITMLVVVAFILIFLIREWVVQQQPVINMVALGEDAAVNQAADQNNEMHQDAAVEEHEHEHEHEQDQHDQHDQQENEAAVAEPLIDGDEQQGDETAVHRRPSFVRRQREIAFELLANSDELPAHVKEAFQNNSVEDALRVVAELTNEEQDLIMRVSDQSLEEASAVLASDLYASSSSSSALPTRSSSLPQRPETTADPTEVDASASLQRPNMPTRDRSFIATEIRRSLEEGNSWSFDNVQQTPDGESREPENIPDSWEDEAADDGPMNRESQATTPEPDSEHSSESWQQVSDAVVENDSDQALEGGPLQDKGKGKADDGDVEASHDSPSEVSSENGSGLENTDVTSESVGPIDHDENQQEEIPVQEVPSPDEATAAADAQGVRIAIAQPVPPLMDRILDWVFGDVAPRARAADDSANDEHVVRNLAEEAPFVPFAGNEPLEPADPPIQDPEVAAAAVQAGIDVNDQDAIEDAEDLEGILELIGMQGPIIGLFQNALFSAVLISATLACAVWLPYLWGKIVILFMGSPISLFVKLPLQIIASLTDLVVDTSLVLVAGATYWISQTLTMAARVCTWGTVSKLIEGSLENLTGPAQSIAENAMDRIAKLLINSPLSPRVDYFRLSINSHVALRSLQNTTSSALNDTSNFVSAVLEEVAAESPLGLIFKGLGRTPRYVQATLAGFIHRCNGLLSWIWASKSYKITFNLDFGHGTTAAYTDVERWTANDRLISVLAGYASFALAGAVYVKRGSPVSTSPQGQRIERVISEILQQAGGVLKVILIISIEMLAFPLYCGLLLDLAMLPLFRNATFYTRWQFARESPWTSGFVHWFIGTCYMFHFALFVSMCRKIMRKGVLYFIRDPDDPTFHPVRDVLERSVTTQLRKIAFSALVYGALVIICLGGVVWSLSRATSGVLPIHWTTEAPSLEFPLDLLFYNFLTPVIIKFYKPGESLNTVCTWWFKRCASALRLSDFLFGTRIKEEEGHHVRPTWFSWIVGDKGDPEKPVIAEENDQQLQKTTTNTYFVRDGRYVRAPASDQARVPKGQAVFVEVDEENVRKDGKTEGGVHNSDLVAMVYIPPWFRVRIACFVVTIWIFMGFSGISVTIIPLLFGRYLFSLTLPTDVEMNDIHAFSLGVYTLGSIAYSGYQVYKFIASLNRPVPSPLSTIRTIAATTTRIGLRVLRFSYVWTSLVFLIPFLFAVLIELYFLMPLHAYLGPSEPHVIHLIQDWTLGFLYSRLAARLVFANSNSRPALAFAAVISDGYLYPNAKIATRCFLLPVAVLFSVAIVVPASFALSMNYTLYRNASETVQNQVWRFSFPAIGLSLVAMLVGRQAMSMLNRWRLVVRDEVYLIGERLHNFGEKRAPQSAAPVVASAPSHNMETEVLE
jgi:E3 ubiquitin-protein ligase MARCH6